jgi:hypothetical protein
LLSAVFTVPGKAGGVSRNLGGLKPEDKVWIDDVEIVPMKKS